MNDKFISIKEATEIYKVSNNTIRKIIKSNIATDHVKTEPIKNRYGFKYLISVSFLDSLYGGKTSTEPPSHHEHTTTLNNQLITKLNNQIDNQQKIIDNQQKTINSLSDTIKDQNKVIVSQSIQIYQLRPSTTTSTEPPNDNIETLIIVVLVVCIVAVIIYLFR